MRDVYADPLVVALLLGVNGRAATAEQIKRHIIFVAAGFAENSPAFQGWVQCTQNKLVPEGRQMISFVPAGTGLVGWTLYPAMNGWAIFKATA